MIEKMLCKKVILHKNKTLCKKYGCQVTSLIKRQYKVNPSLSQICDSKVNCKKNYVLYNSYLHNTPNPGHTSLLSCNCIIQQWNKLYLNIDRRFIHSFASSLILRRSGFFTNSCWRSTDVSQTESETMPGISIDCDAIIRNSSPIATTTEKILNCFYADNEETRYTLTRYPRPKSVLHDLFHKISLKFHSSIMKLAPEYRMLPIQNEIVWVSTYRVHWPVEVNFIAADFKKKLASHKAAVMALTWLKYNGSITDDGQPIFHKVDEEAKQLPALVVKEIYYNDTVDTKLVSKQFHSPKNVLHNIFDEMSRENDNKSLQLRPHYNLAKDGKQSLWICTYHLRWPEEVKFLAKDTKKSIASHKAAIAALTWLKSNNKITNDGLSVTYGKEEIKTITKKTLPVLSLSKSTVNKMQTIIQLHRDQIVPLIVQNKLEKAQDTDESREKSIQASKEVNLQHTRQRYLGLDRYLAKEKVELPIAAYKNDFMKLLKDSQIVIVKGEPGCGKSTRIPQYILEMWAKEDGLLGEPGRIAVTQPRRIAAISLAERVAVERDESVGSIVGYQVRLKSNFNRATGRILYCTTGILLRHIQSDPGLSTFSHIILDEAHERDVNTDLLMNLLRRACKSNPKLKLVVMSATIDTSMFSEYFNGAPILEVPGFTYPVLQHYLDACKKIDVSKSISMCEGDIPSVIHEDVARVIQYIHECKKEGAILCFLPGWEDIRKVQKLIPLNNTLAVYCLHSRLQDSDQWKIFSKPPPGIRKIILATNIAETSVTIDDVVYVVDTGIHKEQRFDIDKGVKCVDDHWISKANVAQRKGRAGRVQPGECFHLYTREKYGSFPDYSLPEIQRTSLTKIVLDSKVFSNNMNAVQFMNQLPTPPEENGTLRAVAELKDLEMLDEEEKLTSLGTVCADFQLEPKLSKAMISAVIFKCVTPVVDIVTLFSEDTAFFSSGMLWKDEIRRIKSGYCKNSDHLAMMRLFEKWLQYWEEGDSGDHQRFCDRTNLIDHKMQTIEKLRKIHYDYLYSGLYEALPIADDYSDNDEMVKAVLYSGVGTILQHRNWDIVKNRLKNNVNCLLTRNNHRATITTESVNHKKSKFATNFLLYINETRSNTRRTTLIRECSLIPNISVLLFSNKDLEIKEVEGEDFSKDIPSQDQVKLALKNTNVEILCDRAQAQDLVDCKNCIMTTYRYYIDRLTAGGFEDVDIYKSWSDVLILISDILSANSVEN